MIGRPSVSLAGGSVTRRPLNDIGIKRREFSDAVEIIAGHANCTALILDDDSLTVVASRDGFLGATGPRSNRVRSPVNPRPNEQPGNAETCNNFFRQAEAQIFAYADRYFLMTFSVLVFVSPHKELISRILSRQYLQWLLIALPEKPDNTLFLHRPMPLPLYRQRRIVSPKTLI